MVYGICIFIIILWIVARWKFFTKFNEDGWKSLIPFYSDYMMFKLTWKTKYFFISLVASILMGVLMQNTNPSVMDSLCLTICEMIVFITFIVRSFYVGRKLNQNLIVSFLLFFFEPIVLLIVCLKKEPLKTE